MKLRTQIVAFGLAGALLAGVVGGIGLVATAGLGVAIDDSILAGQALQASQEADMMHDAIRGDAQLALLGALQKDPQRLTEAEKGLTAHAQTFQKALAQLHALPLSKPTCVGLDRPRSGRVARPCGLQGTLAGWRSQSRGGRLVGGWRCAT